MQELSRRELLSLLRYVIASLGDPVWRLTCVDFEAAQIAQPSTDALEAYPNRSQRPAPPTERQRGEQPDDGGTPLLYSIVAL
jgi:hypothetical protein